MITLVGQHFAEFSSVQVVLWSMYLMAALMLPLYHIKPTLKYLRGSSGIGDACIRTEVIQCGWRVPALMFSMFVAPSLPLFLSILLDMLGRIARIWAMHDSKRRWQAQTAAAGRPPPVGFAPAFPIYPSNDASGGR